MAPGFGSAAGRVGAPLGRAVAISRQGH